MDSEPDPRWVMINGLWRERIVEGQIWRAKNSRRCVRVIRPTSEINQPRDVKDGTRRWCILDDSPLPQFLTGRDTSEEMIWERYDLISHPHPHPETSK